MPARVEREENRICVFDIEADGLLDEITKIHCLSYTYNGKEVFTINDPKRIATFVEKQKFLLGHDIHRYDVKALEMILGVDITAKLYDTLPMSWVMFPKRTKHGLDSFAPDYGLKKPKIDDWKGLTPEEYQYRCEEDVKINWALWCDLLKRFKTLYGNDKENLDRFFQYLSFKMKCAATAAETKWRLDIDLAQKSFNTLEVQQGEKVEELKSVMPMVPVKDKKNKPAWGHTKDGNLYKRCQDWLDFLEIQGLPPKTRGPVEYIKDYKEPNPNSPDQVKEWLSSLGWEPCTYKYVTDDKTGKERKIPQIRYSEPGHPRKGELTDSVKVLIDDNPGVGVLDGLTVIQHRKAIFKNFLENVDEDGYVIAEISGLTNTLRFQHKAPLVNLPGVDKPWGKEVRGCLIAPHSDALLCGSDMASLESTTKRHFIYPYDPEYVEEMSKEGFDEHLDLAVKATYLDQDDYDFYTRSNPDEVNDVDRFKSIKKVRTKFKPVNYSSVYGVGKLKMSRSTGMGVEEAANLIEAYWKRNWAVRKFASECKTKTVNKQMWVWNPVSNFWYTLRYEKDIFSTINQGTGAFCFDTWLIFCMADDVFPCGQFHDEFIAPLDRKDEEVVRSKLRKAIERTNDKLKLNVPLDIDIQFGDRYSEIH